MAENLETLEKQEVDPGQLADMVKQAKTESTPPAPEKKEPPKDEVGQPITRAEKPKQQPQVGDKEVLAYLKQMTAGRINSLEEVKKIPTYQTQMGELQTQLAQLQAKAQMDPFASPFVKEINELIKQGAKPERIKSFVEMSTLDVDTMEPEQAFEHLIRLENPGLSNDDIQVLKEDRFGELPDPEEDEDAYRRAKKRMESRIRIAGSEAKEKLKERLSKTDFTSYEERQAEMEQRRAQLSRGWQHVSREIVNDRPVQVAFSSDSFGGEYQFSYTPPKDGLEEVMNHLVQHAVQNNIPLREESLPQLMNLADNVLKLRHFDQIIQQVAHDVRAKTREEMVRANVGVGPGGRGSRRSAPIPADKFPTSKRPGMV